jgi:cyclophilin family peptidyl-prolyl cis-trans isomerase
MRHWFDWFRRSSRKVRRPSKPVWQLRRYRPNLDVLEDRCLLAAPTIDPIQVPLNIPAGKMLIVPITTQGATDSIQLAPASGTTGITVTPLTGTFLDINVSHVSSGAPGDMDINGTLEFELFGTLTPRTVAYITGLVESGFYNNLTFHRVVNNPPPGLAIIQGGDPNGNGTGGPPGAGATQQQLQQLQYPDEFNPSAIFSGTGQLAMANNGNDTNGSQFFVTDATQRFLDFNHTIFGQLVRGFDILSDIEKVSTDSSGKPLSPVTITSAQIIQDSNAAVFIVQDTSSTTRSVSLTVTASSGSDKSTAPGPGNVIDDTANDPPILDVSQAPLNFGQAPNGNPVKNLTTPKNTPVSFTLSSTDLEGNTPIFSVTETDATPNATVSVNPTTGQVTVTPNAGFTGLINLKASVTAAGSARNNGPDSQVFTIAVGDQPITATGTTVSATAGTAVTQTVATFTDPDTAAAAGSFQVAINWGDGTALDTTSGIVTGSNGQFTVTGTHTYAKSGTYQAQVTVTDVQKPSTTATPANQAYVNQLFLDLIGQAPTSQQLADFSGQLDQGKSRLSVVKQIETLPQFKVHQVQQVYLNMFGVGPTAQQLNSGVQFLTKGDDVGALRVRLLSSDYFFTAVGGGTNTGYLNALGQEILHHPLDTALQSQLNQALTNGASHLQVLKALVRADQQQVKTVAVQNIYQEFLQRAPTAAELSAGLALPSKTRESDLIRNLVTSDEYFNKAGQKATVTIGDNGGARAQATTAVTVS